MKPIIFKFNGGKKDDVVNFPAGWIAVGDTTVHDDGTHLLSSQCVTVAEIEAQAAYLKVKIDEAVKQAKQKLTVN